MKKALSLILSLLIVLSVFAVVPMTANAAESDIAETGATAIGTVYLIATNFRQGYEVEYAVARVVDEPYDAVSIEWWNITDNKKVYHGEKLEAYKEYSVTVVVQPHSGYAFNSGAAGKINGEKAQVVAVTSGQITLKYQTQVLPPKGEKISAFHEYYVNIYKKDELPNDWPKIAESKGVCYSNDSDYDLNRWYHGGLCPHPNAV